MNIKNREAYQLAKQRVRRKRGVDLAERLLLIGRDCAAYLKGPSRIVDHEDLLYNDRGLLK